MVCSHKLAYPFDLEPLGRDVYTGKGFIFFLLTTVIPNNFAGALLGVGIFTWSGLIPADALRPSVGAKSLRNMIITIVIVPILMCILSGTVERLDLTIRGLFT
jgi:hypothetical protein